VFDERIGVLAPLASNKIVWRNVEARDRVNIGAFVEFNLGFNAIHRLTRRKSKEKHQIYETEDIAYDCSK
jgi:hypothetical protein